MLPYLELNPAVERYAWYIPKGHIGENENVTVWYNNWSASKVIVGYPHQNLITEVNAGTLPKLTSLGHIFVNMTICDKTVWVPAAEKIDAAQFTDCNASDVIGTNGWRDIVRSAVCTDSDQSAGVLEINNFTNKDNMWVEYQVNLPQTKNYTLKLRYKTTQNTNMQITVDGGSQQTATLNSNNWTTIDVNMGNLQQGNRTIRLKVTGGNCALNWLKMD